MSDPITLTRQPVSTAAFKGARPAYLSHVVLNTRDVPGMSAWWCKVLGATSMYDTSPGAADKEGQAKNMFDFVSFDDEHHRMAFVNPDAIGGAGPTPGPSLDRPTSLHHVAFTYASMADMVANWRYLKSEGILPLYTVHHGPTISNYYQDPDGNRVELQIDVFASRKELDEWFDSGEFAKHHGAGPLFDFALLAERFAAGVDEAWLRSNDGFVKEVGDPERKAAPPPPKG